jgi:DNA polymerase-3 subunit beta
MQFNCNPREMLKGVSLISSICQTRTTKPILQDIKIVVENNTIQLLGTDLEVAIRFVIPVTEITADGVVVLPALKLLNILREITSDDVDFSSEQRVCTIKTKDSRFKLISDDPDEFPVIPDYDFKDAMSIDANEFVKFANKTLFAVAKDMSCYAYNGILIEQYENGIKFIATDGRRLAVAGNVDRTQENILTSSIVQVKGINQVIKSLDDEDTILTKLFKNQFIMKMGNIEIASRLLEGDFPKYRDVIPEDNKLMIKVDKEDFHSAVRKVSITAGTEVRSVQMNFKPGALKLYSQQEGIGESESEVSIEYEGDKLEITFNPDFLMDYLKVMDAEQTTLYFKDENSSCLIEDNENEFYIVMPITAK